MIETNLRTITEEPGFYGYIIALGIQSSYEPGRGNYLYALFEYSGSSEVWIVPDENLFTALAPHLLEMAVERKTSDGFGCNKLHIEKRNGEWIVQLP